MNYFYKGMKLPPYIPLPKFLLQTELSLNAQMVYALLLTRKLVMMWTGDTKEEATKKIQAFVSQKEVYHLSADQMLIVDLWNAIHSIIGDFAMADEMGKTYHTHLFLYFRSRVRFSMVKKNFPEAHIDVAKGMVSENINYIRKTGKWKDSEKAETSIPDTFEECGKRPPDSKGKLSDMTELYQMVNDGLTNTEILSINQDYILQIDKIDKLRTMLLTEKYKGIIRKNLKVIYVFGRRIVLLCLRTIFLAGGTDTLSGVCKI